MSRHYLKIALNFKYLFVCFLLLISCKSFSFQSLTTTEFTGLIAEIKTLLDDNPGAALARLNIHKDAMEQLGAEEQIKYRKLQAEIYLQLSQYQLSKTVASTGLDLAKQLTSPSIVIAELSYIRGYAFESLGDIEAATQDYLNGLEVSESLNDQKHIAEGLINLGAIYYLTDRYERSLIVLNDALSIVNKLQDDEMAGAVNSELGILYSYIRQEDKSMAFYQKSYEHYKKAGKSFLAFNSLRNIATHHSNNERYEEAIILYKEIIDNAEQISNDEIIASVYSGLARANLKKQDSDPEAAYQYILIAGQYVENLQQYGADVSFAIEKADVLHQLGRDQEALASIELAESLLTNKEDFLGITSMLNILYYKPEIYYGLQQYELAYQYQSEFLNYALEIRAKNDMEVIEDVRMRYESEHADLQKEILQEKQAVQTLLLNKETQQAESRQWWFFLLAAFALVLAWFLVKISKGQQRLLILSRTDALTGVANRRRLLQVAEQYFVQAERENTPFSLLMIDVDYFKNLNDEYGHQFGDKVLKSLATIGQGVMREHDVFGRFGGEEFIALLPETDNQQAYQIAERVRESIHQYSENIDYVAKISVSIGVSTFDRQIHHNVESLLKSADMLLYQAKADGRNKVCA